MNQPLARPAPVRTATATHALRSLHAPRAAPWPLALLMPLALAAPLALAPAAAGAQSANPVNDTGIVFCRQHGSGADTPVSATATCQPLPAHGAQDARHGRDAAAAAGALATATGKGFDFVKISHSGAELPASAALGSGPNDWACTYDRHTGLMWEVKLNDPAHLRHMGHTYTWYFSANTHGGPGVASGGSCHQAGRCDTEKYVADVNAAALCGKTDWRVPTLRELFNLADRGRVNPAIDPAFFPNTPSGGFWSSSPVADDPVFAWGVVFDNGNDDWNVRGDALRLRLVRAGQ